MLPSTPCSIPFISGTWGLFFTPQVYLFIFTRAFKHACRTHILQTFSLLSSQKTEKNIAPLKTAFFVHINECSWTVSYLWFHLQSFPQSGIRKHTWIHDLVLIVYSRSCVGESIRASILHYYGPTMSDTPPPTPLYTFLTAELSKKRRSKALLFVFVFFTRPLPSPFVCATEFVRFIEPKLQRHTQSGWRWVREVMWGCLEEVWSAGLSPRSPAWTSRTDFQTTYRAYWSLQSPLLCNRPCMWSLALSEWFSVSSV